LEKGEKLELDVSFRKDEYDIVSYGKIEGDGLKDISNNILSLDTIAGKGAVIAWIDHEKEPSKHLLNEIQDLRDEFAGWEGKILLVSDPEHISDSFNPDSYSKLPENALFAYDKGLKFLKKLVKNNELDISKLPVLMYITPEMEIIYKSIGYSVGYGEQLLRICRSE